MLTAYKIDRNDIKIRTEEPGGTVVLTGTMTHPAKENQPEQRKMRDETAVTKENAWRNSRNKGKCGMVTSRNKGIVAYGETASHAALGRRKEFE